MSNNILDINGHGKSLLVKTLELVFAKNNLVSVSSWHVTPEHGLIIYWGGKHEQLESFGPTGIPATTLSDIVSNWLNGIDYGKHIVDPRCQKRDIDGDVVKGWQVTMEPDNIDSIPSRDYLVCIIRPAWIYIPK